MTTFALIHGGCHDSHTWDLLIPELEAWGHQALSVDLPVTDPAAGLGEYTDVAFEAFKDAGPVLVVAHSMGGATALGLEDRLNLVGIVLLNSAITYSPEAAPDQPEPMTTPVWGIDTIIEDGFTVPTRHFAERFFYNDLSPEAVTRVFMHVRPQAIAGLEGPDIVRPITAPSVYIRATDDTLVNPAWADWAARTLTGRAPRDIPGSHSTFYSRPADLARTLDGVAKEFESLATRRSYDF